MTIPNGACRCSTSSSLACRPLRVSPPRRQCCCDRSRERTDGTRRLRWRVNEPTKRPRTPASISKPWRPTTSRRFGCRFIRGRAFNESDRKGALPVAVLGESLARRAWPDASPLGKRLKFGGADSPAPWMTVVGVARDLRYRDIKAPPPAIYVPLRQSPFPPRFLIRARKCRASADPGHHSAGAQGNRRDRTGDRGGHDGRAPQDAACRPGIPHVCVEPVRAHGGSSGRRGRVRGARCIRGTAHHARSASESHWVPTERRCVDWSSRRLGGRSRSA